MKVGTICFATNQGLGLLAKSFYDNGVVTDVLTIKHQHHENLEDAWYPSRFGTLSGKNRRRDMEVAESLCRSVDTMLFFETPFYWNLFDYCRHRGVKAVLMPMYECMPKNLPVCPDLMLCPSLLDLQYYPNSRWTCGTTKSIFLPVPVSYPWRLREKALVFVHNAGHGGLKCRNGTGELLDALRLVESPAHFVIRTQKPLPWGVDEKAWVESMAGASSERDVGGQVVTRRRWLNGKGQTLDVISGTVPYENLYSEGDVFVFPEKFNGLSLPLQEARAAGMLVMGTNRFPMNTWLPISCLIPTHEDRQGCVASSCNDYQEAIVDPKAIAAQIDYWYGTDISDYSRQGRAWAKDNSWDALRPRYLEVLRPS